MKIAPLEQGQPSSLAGPSVLGVEAAVYDRSGGIARREVLRLGQAPRHLAVDHPSAAGSVEASISKSIIVAWLRGGSPTVLRVALGVPEGTQARLELSWMAAPGVAELQLDGDGMDFTSVQLAATAADMPLVRFLAPGDYALRAWAFEGDVAIRIDVA